MTDKPQQERATKEVRTIARRNIRNAEGCRAQPYLDTEGHLTVGIGHLLENGGAPLPQDAIESIFRSDYLQAESDAYLVLWKDCGLKVTDLSSHQMAGLVEMCFQLGLTRLRKFKRMLEAISDRDGETAAKEALDSKWAKQTPGRATRIAEMIRGHRDF